MLLFYAAIYIFSLRFFKQNTGQACLNFIRIEILNGLNMQIQANTPDQYIDQLPDKRKYAIRELRKQILANLPKGFKEVVNYGMIGYVIPHSLYPKGYHADPKQPLPFINIASQKNHIALYHMGIYANQGLMDWFVSEFSKYSKTKLDKGKSCIRFNNVEQIPYELIGELAGKMSVENWITIYESNHKRKGKL
jgi:uncharacterized protein YdhG (YjbR/CyaY superfamily)